MALLRLNENGKLMLGGREIAAPAKTICLLLDTSHSMTGDKIGQAKQGAVDFASSVIPKGYSVCVVVFADRGAVVCDPINNLAGLMKKINRVRVGVVGGWTYLAAGLDVCAKVPDLSHILIVTDGQANDAETALEVAERLKARGVEILCIGTDDADRDFLSRLASHPDLGVKVNASDIQTTMGQTADRLLLTSGATDRGERRRAEDSITLGDGK